MTDGLRLSREGAAAVAVLERPGRRNAISREMQLELGQWWRSAARDAGVYCTVLRSGLDGIFSVGGDVRDLLAMAAADAAVARAALADELSVCWQAECFSKPTISLIDGLVIGTGVGVTLYGTHRVAGEGYRFQMPETAIGYFPDCGVAHAFARMPHGIGLYLGLTGAAIGRADAFRLGLVTHCVPRSELAAIVRHLASADPVDPVLDQRHADPGEAPIAAQGARIGRYFGAPTLVEIVRRLAEPDAGDQEFAARTLEALRARSPLALALTDRAIRQAAGLDIRTTLIQDYRLAWRLATDGDFREGVRAVLVDKDQAPRWSHARIEDVPAALVDDYFAPLPGGDLALPTRAEMQAARV